MTTNIELSVILPTYNEAENIPILIPLLQKVLAKYNYEILVMDDNSPDGTYRIVEKMVRQDNRIRCVRRMANRGLSQAVVEGFSVAQGDAMLVMDADMQHDEAAIPQFIEHFRAGADLVVGTRKANGGQIENWSLLRRFISWGATKMAHFFLPQNSSDPMSGFFAVSKNFYNRIATEINPRGFKILLEILAHARGANMQEVGYSFRPRQFGESKLSVSVAFTYLVALYDLKFGRLIPVRFIKYALVGASGVVVNQLVLFLSRGGFKLSDAVALGVAIEISIFWNFIVNNYFTFKDKSLTGMTSLLWGFFKFNFVCLGGAFINYSITMSLVASFIPNIYLANLVGIGVSTIWNYFINLQITWKRELD